MNKKYEEMTREQLGKEADEILKRLQLLVCAGELDPYDISELGKIINTMKDYICLPFANTITLPSGIASLYCAMQSYLQIRTL